MKIETKIHKFKQRCFTELFDAIKTDLMMIDSCSEGILCKDSLLNYFQGIVQETMYVNFP